MARAGTPRGAGDVRWRARRFALVFAAAVLALGLFVAVPAYVSSRPAFFQRYPDLQATYDSWADSTHAEVECVECHVAPTPIARTGYRLLMVGQAYLSSFGPSAPDVFASPTNGACLVCHNDLRTVSPKGDLQIPHRAHVQILEMKCVECHEYLVHEESPSGGHEPEMEGCLRCHDGDRAKNSCWACHTEKAAPASHATDDWLVRHAEESDDPECAGCHDWSGEWCVQCHETRPKSHVTDWRAVHGAAVAEHRNCEACHTGEFCVRCHGELPPLNFDPSLELVE